jgi:hypothetical protein
MVAGCCLGQSSIYRSPSAKRMPASSARCPSVETKQLVPLVFLVALAVLLRVVADPPGELLGCIVGGLVAAVWLDRVSPGHRSSRLGRPGWSWLWLVGAVVVVQLLVWPFMGQATLGVALAIFLGGLMLMSAQNNYGRTN